MSVSKNEFSLRTSIQVSIITQHLTILHRLEIQHPDRVSSLSSRPPNLTAVNYKSMFYMLVQEMQITSTYQMVISRYTKATCTSHFTMYRTCINQAKDICFFLQVKILREQMIWIPMGFPNDSKQLDDADLAVTLSLKFRFSGSIVIDVSLDVYKNIYPRIK